MLQSALEHYRRQQRITAAGLASARTARRRGAGRVSQVVTAFQVLAARDAARSVEDMLAEQNISVDPDAEIVPASVAGVASDGRSLDTLFEQADTDRMFDLMVATQLQDAARMVASMGVTVRDQVGYVRMLNPPSCSRCAVLAGKWFKWNQGFQRHPRCDCRHVPARETNWHGLTTNPDDYFHSLGAAEQDRIFTKTGAQAVRDGADVGQVVNARRGMQRAQVFGQDVWRTLEGTTRRGYAYTQIGVNRTLDRRIAGERYFRTQNVRVMPETIYALAKDREDAIRLLKLNGFVI